METPVRKVYPPEYIKAVDHILATPLGPKRWRMAVALYLNLNPVDDDGYSAKDQYRFIVEENKQVREQQTNKYATNKTESMRHSLSAPTWFLTIIQAFDRVSFDKDNPDAKKNLRRLTKAFPELKIMKVI